MTPQALAFALVIAVSTLLHVFVPSLAKPIFTFALGGLALAAAILSRNAKDVAWIQALEDALGKQQGGADQVTRLRSLHKARRVLGLFLLTFLLLGASGCISSAPIVPVTAANQAQISSCQNTAGWHNGVVIGDFTFGGIGAGAGAIGAIVTDSGQKTALAVTGAAAGALVIIGTAVAGLTGSNFANSHCSDVVGALPLAAMKKTGPQ